MIKALRRKFMISNLLLMSLILCLFFWLLSFMYTVNERDRSTEVLKLTLERAEEDLSGTSIEEIRDIGELRSDKTHSSDTRQRSRAVVLLVQTDGYGNIASYTSDERAGFSEEFIEKLVAEVNKNPHDCDRGEAGSFSFRYMKLPNRAGGYKIVFADTGVESEMLVFPLRAYFSMSIFLFFIMVLISDRMARRAVEPVEKSLNNQSRFIADVSHELKTPLTVILANMDILASKPDDSAENRRKWIDNTKSEAQRMTGLVNDMLFLARADAGVRNSLVFAETDLSRIVKESVLSFESVAFERGVSLSEEIEPDIFVSGDEKKLKQAVNVLTDNALKYVNRGGRVAVVLKQNARSVRCSVINTGPPIPAEKQKNVFERFFRVDEARSSGRGGHGLGLSIAANIIDEHKGRIGLEFSDERGTCFYFSLPSKNTQHGRKHTES